MIINEVLKILIFVRIHKKIKNEYLPDCQEIKSFHEKMVSKPLPEK